VNDHTAGLLIGHGSPDPRHAAALRRLNDRVAERLASSASHTSCDIAFLEHDEPLLRDWLAGRPWGEVGAIGLLLASGYHAQVDIPRELDEASPGVRAANLGTLGLGGWLYEVLERRVADFGGDLQTPAVLVAAGSTQQSARADLRTVCAEWQRRRRARVLAAAVTGPDPRVDDAVSSLDDAASDVVVVPFMLAPGALADRARAASQSVGARCTDPITTEQDTPAELVNHLAGRLTRLG
jgi:sirohydrochlorin ferrochelatase